jgi:SAM-dependent methyltransferase
METIDKKTFYDEEYFEGHTKAHRPPYSRELVYSKFLYLAKMLKRQTHPETVLDLGCAKGYFVEAFLELGAKDVWGIDISKYAVYNSPPEIRHRLIIGDIEEGLPFEDDKFDLITAIDLFEHLYHPSNVLEESYRILKKGGKMYMSICSEHSSNAPKDKSHINIISRQKWIDIIEGVGFNFLSKKMVNVDYRFMVEKR